MPSRAYYLSQAKLYFDMATMAQNRAVRGRWIDRANEYTILADAMGADPMPEMLREVTQPQAQQLQQQQAQRKDENTC